MQEHYQKPAGSVLFSICLTVLRFSIHISAVAVSKEPRVHEVVRSLMKLYNPHALDLTIANAWVRSSS